MFQNEMPYDAPDQGAWRHGDALGYPAYKVAERYGHTRPGVWAATSTRTSTQPCTPAVPSRCRVPLASGCTTC